MKFYLIDDDKNIINILKRIIRDRQLGEICGTASNGIDALEDLELITPDIVIVDLLMPEMDGITFVKRAQPFLHDASVIMLSQVSSKDMIASAYENGVEFYIQKPLNVIEAVSVIQKVSESLTARRTLKQVQNLFAAQSLTTAPQEPSISPYSVKLNAILTKLGIIGEKGSKDIIQLVTYLIENGERIGDTTIHELCSKFSSTPKSMEQRIRRSAFLGMVNLANLGLEDYANEIFTEYAGTLYNFEQIRREMDYIRGKSIKHGVVKIKSFINALVLTSLET